jgi:hypothetical protein
MSLWRAIRAWWFGESSLEATRARVAASKRLARRQRTLAKRMRDAGKHLDNPAKRYAPETVITDPPRGLAPRAKLIQLPTTKRGGTK